MIICPSVFGCIVAEIIKKKNSKGEVVVSLTKSLMIQLDAPDVSFLVEKRKDHGKKDKCQCS